MSVRTPSHSTPVILCFHGNSGYFVHSVCCFTHICSLIADCSQVGLDFNDLGLNRLSLAANYKGFIFNTKSGISTLDRSHQEISKKQGQIERSTIFYFVFFLTVASTHSR
jgi:hypothetical protein